MSRLELIIFTLTLLAEGGSSRESVNVFYHCEQDATLPCKGPSSYGPPSCSSVSWLYNRNLEKTFHDVRGGNVIAESGRGDRLSLNPDCSLVVRNIMAEDVGRYTCRQNEDTYYDVNVHLNILTVRLDPAVSDQRRNDEVQLECTLFRYRGFRDCRPNGLRWLNESRMEMKEGVQKYSRGGDCLTRLTVKLQSGSSRRFSCQYLNTENKMEIEAGYTPGFKDPGPALTPVPEPDPVSDSGPVAEPGPDLTFIIVGVLLGVLLLLVVSSVVLLKRRWGGAKVTEDVQTPAQPPDETENDLTYVSVSHFQHQEKRKRGTVKEEKEEEVTYSAVRSGVRTETDADDPSSLYSNISRPK